MQSRPVGLQFKRTFVNNGLVPVPVVFQHHLIDHSLTIEIDRDSLPAHPDAEVIPLAGGMICSDPRA